MIYSFCFSVQKKTGFLLAATVILVMVFTVPVSGQLSLTGEFRPRSEYRHGFSTLMEAEEDAAFFVSQRTRINLGLDRENYSFGFSLQDIRVWGEVPQLNRSDLNSSVHEAWGEVRVSDAMTVKAGRQEIVYDNARMFGNVDWAQQGRSHDAAILKWQPGNLMQVHAGFAYNQESERRTGTWYSLNNYKAMQYLWVNRGGDEITWSFLVLNHGMQKAGGGTVYSQTAGGRIVLAAGNNSLATSAYMQRGRDLLQQKLSAYYLSAEYSRPLTEGLTFTGGFELLSGTGQQEMSDPGFEKNNSFTPFFGTNHAFNGHMDYFYVGNHLNNVGLRDIYGGLAWGRQSPWSAGFRLHLFFSDGLLIDPVNTGETMPRYLGTEIDIFAGYNIAENTVLRAGYSHMLASESMEVLKGGSRNETSNWAWVMLIMKPDFLNR
jgi:hypothetical protein